jgi:broad specificity phosphatase PhoE
MNQARRRLLLMRHGAVEYFDADGRPYPAEAVPLTPAGIEQARAVGAALHAQKVAIDRAVSSGLTRTESTLAQVLTAGQYELPVEVEPGLQEIRGGRLSKIPQAQLRSAFLEAFEGPVPEATRFLHGETIGQLLDRVLPALERLLADTRWDTLLVVAHGGVNRAILSWFLTGGRAFLGGLAQDPGCLNIIDVGATAARSVVRVVNFCPPDPLRGTTRESTMEELLAKYLKARDRSDPA